MTQARRKTASLLARLWVKNRPLIEERLDTLDLAASSAAAGLLEEDLREAAVDVAHKLAGSLGMYGYEQGTVIARQLELLLRSPPPDPARLGRLTVELRQTISWHT